MKSLLKLKIKPHAMKLKIFVSERIEYAAYSPTVVI